MAFRQVFSILILFGIILIGFWYFKSLKDYQLAQTLQKEGIKVSAKVEGQRQLRKVRRTKKKYRSLLKIAFKTQKDSVHTEVGISWTESIRFSTGDIVEVYYLPSDSENVVLLAEKVESPSQIWFYNPYPQYFWFGILFWIFAGLSWKYRNATGNIFAKKK